MAIHDLQLNYKKNELNKMKKNDLLNIINTKTNIILEGKHTKPTLITKILEYQEKTTKKIAKKSPTKKKRGRKSKTELNIESIIANNEKFKEKKNNEPNIIVHLSGVTLDSIKQFKTNKDPLKYNPFVNIPKENSSIKETNFAWVKKNEKNPITSFSFLTKKNQKKGTQESDENHDENHTENHTENSKSELRTEKAKPLTTTLEREFEYIKCVHDSNWYNEKTDNIHMKEIVKEQNIEKIKREPYNRIEKGRQNILRELQYANRTNKWPESVSMCCAWDFHEFSTRPIAIPTKIVDGVAHLEDVCCSLECAAAYIFCNEDGMFDDTSEIYSLLHYVYQQTEQINPAPSRRTLKERGGHYTIEEFRQLSANQNKTARVVIPPFLSCIPIQEEVSTNIHINSAGITNMYIPVNKTRLDKASINIQEFRKKSSQVNNLGSYMNIVYK